MEGRKEPEPAALRAGPRPGAGLRASRSARRLSADAICDGRLDDPGGTGSRASRMVRRTTNSAAPGDRVRRPTAIRARTKTMTRGSLPETGRRSPFRDRSGFDWIWFLFRIRGRVRRRDFWLRFALPSTVIFMALVQVDLAAGG